MSTTKENRPIALAMMLGVSLALCPSVAATQDYPTRPIKIIVGFAPGGGVDTVARLVGQEMSKGLGQSVVIENLGEIAAAPGRSRTPRARPLARRRTNGSTG
jgi:tripartite-type tricarboxylate transporter receptor subunit TctC